MKISARDRYAVQKAMNAGFEVLAPAGSLEIFKAVIDAGADAVYVGGVRFGARAYAGNFSEEELIEALDYAHLRGKKVYLTVNTLLKNSEIESVKEYLLPYYEHGLDAVLVQDFGALNLIHRWYPDLPIHTSTQMTVCGTPGVRLLGDYSVSRVVMAREMSISEMKRIHDETGMELEAFVHGALCYCYSGQCLFSSLLGGRSGNRGRCAQPCRLPYRVYDAKGNLLKDECFVLSLKDLCGVSQLPKLYDAGVYSLKIEGRMKQKSYAAGVVSYYRKYADLCMKGKQPFSVTNEDKKAIAALGNRCGFTEQYFEKHNDVNMVTYDKPSFTQQEIETAYEPLRIPVYGYVSFKEGEPSQFTVTAKDCSVTVTGKAPEPAQKQPMTESDVTARLKKTGDTAFTFEGIEVCMEEGLFVPNGQLNQLRRDALAALEEEILKPFQRQKPHNTVDTAIRELAVCSNPVRQTVLVSERAQLAVVLGYEFVTDIYLDSSAYLHNDFDSALLEDVMSCHRAKKRVCYVMPSVFRMHTQKVYEAYQNLFTEADLDGFVVTGYDALSYVKEHFAGKQIITNHNMYTYNDFASDAFYELGVSYDTVPLELNRQEIKNRQNNRSEIMLYGYYPLMTSAQCVHKNVSGCDKSGQTLYLSDRYQVKFPVKNCCNECYNVIYNSLPVMLFSQLSELKRMKPGGFRLDFTIESPKQVKKVMDLYREFLEEKRTTLPKEWQGSYTNGHYKRGVE